MFQKIINSKSKTFLAFCFSFLAGVAAISIIDKHPDFVYLYVSFFIIIALLIISWHHKTARFIVLCVCCVLFGIARYTIAFPTNSPHQISHYNGQKLTVTGYVAAEPDIRIDGVRYIVRVQGTGIKEQRVVGKIYLKSDLYPRYRYGEVLEIECKLEKPEPIEDFRYDKYLARFGVFSICDEPKIHSTGLVAGNPVLGQLLSVKNAVAERINKLWHEPYASFMAGLLYGYRGGLGDLSTAFNTTGLAHIVALSGYNISVVATVLITLCMYVYIPRKKAFWLVVSGIAIFVIATGASASVVRAGIMGIITLLATQVGRMSRVGNLLAFSAALMTLHNPFILLSDAGFQLSFFATLGLVYIQPVLEKIRASEKLPEAVRETLLSTFAAIIATLPLIVYQFGRISIVAPVVNLLVLWLIPFLMLFGFSAVMASFIFMPLRQVIAWIAFAGLKYITAVVTWFAALSFASVQMHISWWAVVLLYGMIGVGVICLKDQN